MRLLPRKSPASHARFAALAIAIWTVGNSAVGYALSGWIEPGSPVVEIVIGVLALISLLFGLVLFGVRRPLDAALEQAA